MSDSKIIVSKEDFKTILQRAIEQYEKTGKIPTYEELEEKNILIGIEIQKLMDD